MLRYALVLSYDGTNYYGWQAQPNTATVQGVLEEKLSLKLGQKIELTGCGRTDTGVHARNYVAHFDTELVLDETDFLFQTNRILPSDIVLHRCIKVSSDFHARFAPLEREYKYYISTQKNVWNRNYTYYMYGSLDIELMNQACKLLLGEQDFACFCRSGGNQNSTICKVTAAYWELQNNTYEFTIIANRFLRNMVRAVVGTLIAVGQHKINLSDVQKILDSKQRSMAKKSAPAKGLFLNRIAYVEHWLL